VLAKAVIAVAALIVVLAVAPPAAARSASIAALQVALRARGFDVGPIDGVAGPRTERAVRLLQARVGVEADGVVGPSTRRALGRLGRHRLGSRPLASGAVGWDVSELQFLLAARGFAGGTFDGRFGARTAAAVRRLQRHAGTAVDGVAGTATVAAVRRAPPRIGVALARPLASSAGEGFGPRDGARFHTGVDFPAPHGTIVRAARAGRIAFAGRYAGYGYLVTIAHDHGLRTMYAHLARIDVRLRQHVAVGAAIGTVGATGTATGPHLHFEARVRGAAVDPRAALGL
jgi:murein DD-endopeptidase MepM/ murein hydrolase activator NlpD